MARKCPTHLCAFEISILLEIAGKIVKTRKIKWFMGLRKKHFYYHLTSYPSLVKITTSLGNLKGWPALVLMIQKSRTFTIRVLKSKHCPVFFCVSSSLKDLLSHLIYSFCLIPSHPLNSAVPISTGKGGLHLQNYCISLYPHGFPPLYDINIYLPSRHSFSTTQPLPGKKQLWFTCSQ